MKVNVFVRTRSEAALMLRGQFLHVKYTHMHQVGKNGQTERAGRPVSSSSHLIGWPRSSQLGVVLQDDLQLLTQHDVPSNLQLAREERLLGVESSPHHLHEVFV